METPKKSERALKKLSAQGEEPVLIFPALLERFATEQMKAMVRIGMGEDIRIFSYLVATDRNVHFISPGMMWDKVRSVPLDKVDDVEYVDEFHNNTLKLKVGTASESILFYDDLDGVKFYQHIKGLVRNRKGH
jgi:hypothetical protein